MTETPKCPYCGAEMLDDSYTWICPKCYSNSPVVIWDEEKIKGMTEEEKMAYAREAALHRAAPENKPLTLDEVLELGKDDDSIAYIESKRFNGCGYYQPCTIIHDAVNEGLRLELHFYEPGNELPEFWPEAEYGKSWRCWPRKPTPEQMAAEKWEE